MSAPKIEVLVVRDPDGGTDLQLWVDGEPTDAWSVEVVDPGAGHMRSDWDQATSEVSDLGYSGAFEAAVIAARGEWADSGFVMDDRDEEEQP